jgi:hypothetical protein
MKAYGGLQAVTSAVAENYSVSRYWLFIQGKTDDSIELIGGRVDPRAG